MHLQKRFLLWVTALTFVGLIYAPLPAIEVDSAEAFLAAIESGEKKLEIINSFTLSRQKSGSGNILAQNNDFLPIRIPSDTRIYSTKTGGAMPTLGFRFPVQLEGNVTFENLTLNFTNTTDYQRTLFMSGHTLTLENIRSSETGYNFNIYAGSFDFATDAPTEGTAAHLTINAPNAGSAGDPNPKINAVYLSSIATSLPTTFKPFSRTATMTLTQKTRIKTVYANGAQITITGDGLQAATRNYVTDTNTTLILTDGVTQALTTGTFKEIVLPTGTTLALNELTNTSEVTISSLTGGGQLLRNNAGNVNIQNYTGSTTVRATSASDGMKLFTTSQTPNDTHTFVLDSINQKAGYKLDNQSGTFTLATIPYYTILITPNPVQGGTVTEDNNYRENETITLQAIANAGYIFVGWSAPNGFISTHVTETLTVTEPMEIDAYFLPIALHSTLQTNAVTEKAAGLAISAPVIQADSATVNVGITLQIASELPSDTTEWKNIETIIEDSATFDITTSTLSVKLPANGKGFFQFTKANGLEK